MTTAVTGTSGAASAVEAGGLSQEAILGRLQAIDRVQAIIEFALDGTILNANQNFLNVLGYRLEEIRGRHHSMFVDPTYARSEEYRQFWERLNQGRFDAGEYRRITKDGKDVWILASYNPILDANGRPVSVVKYATDITAQKLRNADFEGQISAISKSQAVIEFAMDGTIVGANENFLATLGYRLEEIKGQHHRMFVEPEYGRSEEYRQFWARLNDGRYEAGEFKRLGKNGREVWIQASYNPILDLRGRPFKVVKYASDVTAQRRAINEAMRVVTALSHGDLTEAMEGEVKAEFLPLKDALNGSIANLRNMVSEIRQAAARIAEGAGQINEGNTNLSSRTQEQAAALEETASTVEQMTSTVKQNADNAKQASQLAANAREMAEKGGDVVGKAVRAMGDINSASKKIADIISVIDEIAFQTNLLALNAAVEAARAGEQGRGFAVVAAEVRNLAQRSAAAAKEIKTLIKDSVEKVDSGTVLVDRSGTTLQEIVLAVKKVSDIIGEIAAASQEQAAGITQVNKAVTQMDETTQQNAALVEEAAAASAAMDEQAQALAEQVRFFRTDDHEADEPPRHAEPAPPAKAASKPRHPAPAKPRHPAPATRTAPPAKPTATNGARPNGQRRPTTKPDGQWEEF